MKKIVTLLSLLTISCSAFAAVPFELLLNALEVPKVKEALKKQEGIKSLKIVYDKAGRAAFDFTIVVCGISLDSDSQGNESISYITTKVDGKFAYFGDSSNGEIVQTSAKTADPLCQ